MNSVLFPILLVFLPWALFFFIFFSFVMMWKNMKANEQTAQSLKEIVKVLKQKNLIK